jgi:hypothetical protein
LKVNQTEVWTPVSNAHQPSCWLQLPPGPGDPGPGLTSPNWAVAPVLSKAPGTATVSGVGLLASSFAGCALAAKQASAITNKQVSVRSGSLIMILSGSLGTKRRPQLGNSDPLFEDPLSRKQLSCYSEGGFRSDSTAKTPGAHRVFRLVLNSLDPFTPIACSRCPAGSSCAVGGPGIVAPSGEL